MEKEAPGKEEERQREGDGAGQREVRTTGLTEITKRRGGQRKGEWVKKK